LEWTDEDRENANVPMEMYENACVTDAKAGVEVREKLWKNERKRF